MLLRIFCPRTSLLLIFGIIFATASAAMEELPEEDLTHILSFCSAETLGRTAQVSHRWNVHFRNRQSAHISDLIDKATKSYPPLYRSTITIAPGFKFLPVDTKDLLWIDPATSLPQDWRIDPHDHEYWLSITCPFTDGQEKFQKPLLNSIVSALYRNLFKLDQEAICRVKHCLGEIIFSQDASEEHRNLIYTPRSYRSNGKNRSLEGKNLTYIHNINSPQEEMDTLVKKTVEKMKENVKSSEQKKRNSQKDEKKVWKENNIKHE